MRRLELAGIGTTRVGDIPVLILRAEGEDRVIPVQLAPPELESFAAELQGIRPERPMTHDLVTDIVHRMGASVSRVAITEIRDDAYHALVTLTTASGEVAVDARPSDAIALALRANAPIFASDEVLDEGSVIVEFDDDEDDDDDQDGGGEEHDETVDRFRDFLDTVDPGDFTP